MALSTPWFLASEAEEGIPHPIAHYLPASNLHPDPVHGSSATAIT
jgi:hypothetical protein